MVEHLCSCIVEIVHGYQSSDLTLAFNPVGKIVFILDPARSKRKSPLTIEGNNQSD